ncbi:MAG: CHASE2 domain-containing protein [Nitrospirales bacterium]|nr:CHASE2 domain-containing protein [Nitrospirales bacterium]
MSLSRRLFQGAAVGLLSGALALLAGHFSVGRNLELMTLDARYRLRPPLATLPELGFIDYDDSSLELFGEWPWPRYRQVALVRTLHRYDARSAGYDVFFVERENTLFHPDRLNALLSGGGQGTPPPAVHGRSSRRLLDEAFREYDREFADAVGDAGSFYLAYFTADPDEKSVERGQAGIREETEKIRKDLSPEKRKALQELEKTFLPVPAGAEGALYKTVALDPPLPELTRAARGVGFAQPGIDDDSVKRNYILFRSYRDRMLYSVTLRMLSDLMDFSLADMEVRPGEYVMLRNALEYRTGRRRDIRIPVDAHCQFLLNWAGPFQTTFLHVPFRLLSFYHAHAEAKEIARSYENPGMGDMDRIGSRIAQRLREEAMVSGEEAVSLSREIAAARVVSGLLERGAVEGEVSRRIREHPEHILLQRVLAVLSAARSMEKALRAHPGLRFEQYRAEGGHLSGREEAGSGVAPDEPHLREIFRNMSFFAAEGRLEEARPYYFPPPRKVLNNGKWTEFSPVDLKGKIFMIGLTGTNTIDLKPSPFEENCPLVAYHANALNTVLSGNFLHYPPAFSRYAPVLLLSLLTGTAGMALSMPVFLLVSLSLTGGYLFATYQAWVLKGYWLEWVAPSAGVVLTGTAVIVLQFTKAFRERKKVRNIFSTMVSPAVLKVMEENPDKFSLTGERKAATTFFSMINGIGNITRSVAPDELASLLSVYLTPTSEIITQYDGYIDKYEGHIIMADFGVPLDDADNPWKCAFSAIEQKLEIESFRYFVQARYGLDVGVSMGFNYGYVSAGNMGSERKFQYTVMGDPVNVAARFMASNSIYRSRYPLTGEDTVTVIRDYVEVRLLDRLLLKGKTKPTEIYTVLGWKPDAYREAMGKGPVPPFLYALWTKCPPEKILGYHHLWSMLSRKTGHPLAEEIRDFFSRSLEGAREMPAQAGKGKEGRGEQGERGLSRAYRESAAAFLSTLRGRREEYHEMMSLAGAPSRDELRAGSYYEEALALYWQRKWEPALEKLDQAERHAPGEGPSASLRERIGSYRASPPDEGWQGEFVQTKK